MFVQNLFSSAARLLEGSIYGGDGDGDILDDEDDDVVSMPTHTAPSTHALLTPAGTLEEEEEKGGDDINSAYSEEDDGGVKKGSGTRTGPSSATTDVAGAFANDTATQQQLPRLDLDDGRGGFASSSSSNDITTMLSRCKPSPRVRKLVRRCAVEVVNLLLFNSCVRKMKFPFSLVVSMPFKSFLAILVIYLVFLIIYFPLYLCSYVILPIGSIVLFRLFLIFLARYIASMMAFVGCTLSMQSNLSKEYLRRLVSFHKSHYKNLQGYCASALKQSASTLGRVGESIEGSKPNMRQILQYSGNLSIYSQLLKELSENILASASELRENDMLRDVSSSDNRNDINNNINRSSSIISDAIVNGNGGDTDLPSLLTLIESVGRDSEYELYLAIGNISEELGHLTIELMALINDVFAKVISSRGAFTSSGDIDGMTKIANISRISSRKATLLFKMLDVLVTTTRESNTDNADTLGVVPSLSSSSAAADAVTDPLASASSSYIPPEVSKVCSSLYYGLLRVLCGRKYQYVSIRNDWSHEKLSLPYMRSVLVRKYGATRVRIKGSSDNLIDGIVIPAARKVFCRETAYGNGASNNSNSNSNSNSNINDNSNSNSSMSFNKSSKGMVLFLGPNAGYYENLELIISSKDPNNWFYYYHHTCGYDFATFNYRGYSLSDGTPLNPDKVQSDGLIFAKHIMAAYGISSDRLIVHGQSIGGFIATFIASSITNSQIRLNNNNYSSSYSSSSDERDESGSIHQVNNNRSNGYNVVETTENVIVTSSVSSSITSSPVDAVERSKNNRSLVLVVDRTFSSLSGVANRMLLDRNFLGNLLKYLALWNTANTVADYLSCEVDRKIILQDPFDEIIAFPSSIEVGVATEALISKNFRSKGVSSQSRMAGASSEDTSHSNNSSSDNRDYEGGYAGASLYIYYLWRLPYIYLRKYFNMAVEAAISISQPGCYFDTIKYLSPQYNINNYCGFDLPNRDKEKQLLDKFQAHLSSNKHIRKNCNESYVNAPPTSASADPFPLEFVEHFTACLRQIHVCAKFESNYRLCCRAREVEEGGYDINKGRQRQKVAVTFSPSVKPDLATHPTHPRAPWIHDFCSTSIKIEPQASSSSYSYSSTPSVGLFQRGWIAVARIDGGFGQLLGQSLKTSASSFQIDSTFRSGRKCSNNQGQQPEHGISIGKSPFVAEHSFEEDSNSDDVSDDVSDEQSSFDRGAIQLPGPLSTRKEDTSPVNSSISSSSFSIANTNTEGLHGHEMDSVCAWICAVLTWGDKSKSASVLMPSMSMSLGGGIEDLRYMINAFEYYTTLVNNCNSMSDTSGSSHGISSRGGNNSNSSAEQRRLYHNEELIKSFISILEYSEQRRRESCLSDINTDNCNLRSGHQFPLLTSVMSSLQFVCQSLVAINTFLSSRCEDSTAVDSSSDSSSIGGVGEGETTNSSRRSRAFGTLLPIHSGHNGWMSPENMSEFQRLLDDTDHNHNNPHPYSVV